jgi:hypothetical protein
MRAVEAGSVPQAVVQMLVFIAVSRMSPLFWMVWNPVMRSFA